MLDGMTHRGGLPSLPDRAGVKFCQVNVQDGFTHLAGVRFAYIKFAPNLTNCLWRRLCIICLPHLSGLPHLPGIPPPCKQALKHTT